MKKLLLSLTLLLSCAATSFMPIQAADPSRQVRDKMTIRDRLEMAARRSATTTLKMIRPQIASLEGSLQEAHTYAETGDPRSIGQIDQTLHQLQQLRTEEQAMQQQLDRLQQ